MKHVYLLFLSGIMLFGACSNDDEPKNEEPKGFAPEISATISNETSEKSGVIENNNNYATSGEKFYWNMDDAVKVFFDDEELNYSVYEVNPTHPNVAEFKTNDNLSEYREYDIYSFSPNKNDVWNFNNNTLPYTVTIPKEQIQKDNTSRHLGTYMPMRAIMKDVDLSVPQNISLNYEQLGAVIRILVKNDKNIPNLSVAYIKINAPHPYKFHTQATLQSRDALDLTTESRGNASNLILNCIGGGKFDVNNDNIFTGFLGVLPGEAISGTFTVEVYYTDGYDMYYIEKRIDSGSFWSSGINAGTSYYIRLLTGDPKPIGE